MCCRKLQLTVTERINSVGRQMSTLFWSFHGFVGDEENTENKTVVNIPDCWRMIINNLPSAVT